MPRKRIPIGASKPQQKHLDALVTAYTEGQLTLFIGAGTSVPYGVPTWDELVTGLLLSEAGNRFKDFYPHYRTALASWLGREFDFSPTMLARVVKYNLQKGRGTSASLAAALQKRLYANLREPSSASLLDEIVRLIQHEQHHIYRVVNFNFDDLLIHRLREAGVRAYPRYERDGRRPRNGGLEVLHPHGFVPRPGSRVPRQSLVFTEDEYNRITIEPMNWAATEIASTLANSVGFFLGLSMNDPNIRRILDSVGPRKRGEARHYLLRLEYSLDRIDLRTSVKDIQLRAEQEFDRRSPGATGLDRQRWIKKSLDDVEYAIQRALDQAHVYDRQLFKDLGVGTLWVDSFADMPKVLEWIRTRSDEAS